MTDIYEYVQKELGAERPDEEKAARIVALVDTLRGYEQDIIFEHEALYHDDEDEQRGNAWLRVVTYAAVATWLAQYPLGAAGYSAWWLPLATFAGAVVVIIGIQTLTAVLAARGAARDEEEYESETDAEQETS